MLALPGQAHRLKASLSVRKFVSAPPAYDLTRLPPVCLPACLQRSDEIAAEKNRALKAALNAELRKTKATLLEQAIPLLDKMARKGKGLTPEKIQARQQLVAAEAAAMKQQAALGRRLAEVQAERGQLQQQVGRQER